MKILSVTSLALPDIKVVRFARFRDDRGFFTEPFRRSDFDQHPEMTFLANVPLVQTNESHSRPGVVRGLHFQWNPFMGKLVRTVSGHMVDVVLDIRQSSATLGQALMYDMPADTSAEWSEWIWVPPGFAHGNFFAAESRIEYFCSGEYSPGCEAGISPLAPDIEWKLCDPALKASFDALVASGKAVLSEKDRTSPNLTTWLGDERSVHFV